MGFRLSDLSGDLRVDLNSDLLEHYEERAAIMEFDGWMSRDEAERQALQEVLGNLPSPAAQECMQNARYGSRARRSAVGV